MRTAHTPSEELAVRGSQIGGSKQGNEPVCATAGIAKIKPAKIVASFMVSRP